MKRWPRARVDGFVQGADHAEQGRLEHVGRVAHGVRHFLVSRGHAVERSMGLDVVERHAFRLQKSLQGADLIDQTVGQLLAADFHFAAAETLQIWQRGMRADRHPVGFCESDRRAHVVEVRGVKSTGHVGYVDQRHQMGVVAHPVETEGLAHVAVQGGHEGSYRSL